MKKRLFVTLFIFVIASVVLAQSRPLTTKQRRQNVTPGGTSCGQDPLLPTDGTVAYDFVSGGATNWYLVNLKAGHSYAVEVYDNIDTVVAGTASLTLTASDCITTLPTTEVASMDPDLTGAGDRISWIQSADFQAYVQVNTSDPNGTAYNLRIVDTTLHNPRWSTFSGYKTQYAIWNVTEATITGTLTLTQVIGNGCCAVYTSSISIPTGNQSFTVISQGGTIDVPPNQSGNALLAFIGPPGALVADAYFTGPGIVPSTFGPRNYQH